jgi:hypothetical protein
VDAYIRLAISMTQVTAHRNLTFTKSSIRSGAVSFLQLAG